MRIGLLLLAAAAGLSAGCFGTSATVAHGDESAARSITPIPCLLPEDAAQLADQVTELVNDERADYGLRAVTGSAALARIADDYACRMIEEQFFGHRDPISGRGPGERAIYGKYRFFAVGENLATGPQTAAEVVELWLQSDSHREVILDERWVDFGMAVRVDAEGTFYWVQEFGYPLD